MQRPWFGFSKKEKVRDKLVLLSFLFIIIPSLVLATDSVDLATLPEAETRVVSSSQTGVSFQVGDRIAVSADLKSEWFAEASKGINPEFELVTPSGSSPLRDLGWYIDPRNLLVSGGIRFVISPLKGGKLTLPTLLVQIKSKDTAMAVARTRPLQIEVEEFKADPSKQPEWIGPLSVAIPKRYLLYGVLILALLIFSILYLRRKFKRIQAPPSSVPPEKKLIPEHILAIQQIESLYQNHAYSSDSAKPIAFGITNTLKEFFSKRFNIDASESTTYELIQKLKMIGMAPHDCNEIQTYFEELDLIKFAAKEHRPYYSLELHQNFKVKALALIQRWARLTNETAGESK